MLAIIAVLGVASAIALPKAAPLSFAAAGASAVEGNQTLRFVQREALGITTCQQVSAGPAPQMLRIRQANAAGGISAIHPIDKLPCKIGFAGIAMIAFGKRELAGIGNLKTDSVTIDDELPISLAAQNTAYNASSGQGRRKYLDLSDNLLYALFPFFPGAPNNATILAVPQAWAGKTVDKQDVLLKPSSLIIRGFRSPDKSFNEAKLVVRHYPALVNTCASNQNRP